MWKLVNTEDPTARPEEDPHLVEGLAILLLSPPSEKQNDDARAWREWVSLPESQRTDIRARTEDLLHILGAGCELYANETQDSK